MVTTLLALRQAQPLLLAAILLTACAVKLVRVIRHRSIMSLLGLLGAELLALALVSPEVGGLLTRLGYSEPCQVRSQQPQQPLTALHRSRAWRRHARLIAGEPADMWRELCWWYVVYPARGGE